MNSDVYLGAYYNLQKYPTRVKGRLCSLDRIMNEYY
jgi:hypothetical protein